MRLLRSAFIFLICSLLVLSCDERPLDPPGGNGTEGNGSAVDSVPQKQENKDKYGLEYLYDGKTVPEFHIDVSIDQWNTLLGYYDKDRNTKKHVKCNVRYVKGGEETVVTDAALRLRGNTSRRRPEGNGGQKHVAGSTAWHHCHFQVNFHKNVKDSLHKVHGAKKVVLKWFKDDPTYVRELYCYDLFRRAGIWTAANSAYCRLYLKVDGDPKEAYYGIYNMIEPIDETYLKARKASFSSADGFLWKCRYGAGLSTTNADFGADLDDGREHVYELKTHTDSLAQATAQMKDFITKLNSLEGEQFRTWITQVCDVPLLMKTYAVNVAVGMWDDYWNNCNNYYIYFNSTDKSSYKFYFIPFDYDNTLGTSSNCGVQSDSGRQDPFNWGDKRNPLIAKLLGFDEFREVYKQELLRLVTPVNKLMDFESSRQRILDWQRMIDGMTPNDTGEDQVITDRPASWGNHGEYRLVENSSNNYFSVKAETVRKYCL